jgi:choline-sulfatase
MEPHTPYLCPPERVREIRCQRRAKAINAKLFERDWGFDDTERALVRELYDADVERMDDELGDFLGKLEVTGVLEDTWVILVADHGELLGERGYFLHGKALYEPLLRIPMLFRAPGGVGRVARTPVSLIDAAPTIAALAGVESHDTWQGRSLTRALAGKALANRPVVAELYMHNTWSKHRFAIIDGEDKYLLEMSGEVSRFRVAEDPGEDHPVPARTEDLERILASAGLEVDLRDLQPREENELTDEQRGQLEALGYLNGGSRPSVAEP